MHPISRPCFCGPRSPIDEWDRSGPRRRPTIWGTWPTNSSLPIGINHLEVRTNARPRDLVLRWSRSKEPPTRGPRETRGFRGVGNTGARVFVQYARDERRPGVPAKSKISWGGRWTGCRRAAWALEIRRHFFNSLLGARPERREPAT